MSSQDKAEEKPQSEENIGKPLAKDKDEEADDIPVKSANENPLPDAE